jgi:Protein of unknown function (DUF2459)
MVRLVCLFLTVLVAACSAPVTPTADDAIVYVIRREWHTDIGLPVGEIVGPLATLEKPFPGVRFLTFGFGERQFLVNHEKGFGAMLGALLPSQSALLMTALSATPEQAFGPRNVIVLPLSRAGLDGIEATIWHEFELSPAGKPNLLADGPYPGSQYFAARDTYYGLYTCNTWTAETLRAGGLPMPATGVLFAGQVMGAASWIGSHQISLPNVIAKSEATKQPDREIRDAPDLNAPDEQRPRPFSR